MSGRYVSLTPRRTFLFIRDSIFSSTLSIRILQTYALVVQWSTPWFTHALDNMATGAGFGPRDVRFFRKYVMLAQISWLYHSVLSTNIGSLFGQHLVCRLSTETCWICYQFNRRWRLYLVFKFILHIKYFEHVSDKTWHKSARFRNRWPPFCQISIIFTHLEFHNFTWLKIQNK